MRYTAKGRFYSTAPVMAPFSTSEPGHRRVIDDPLFFVIAIPALLLVGISKGAFGGGLGMLAVVMMALVVSPVTAAAIMLPILCLMDIFGVYAYRGRWHQANMRILIPAAVVGIVVGAVSFRYMDASLIRVVIGFIAVSFSLNYWLRPDTGEAPAREPSTVRGGFWGGIAGFTSFVTHAGGPPVAVYLLPQRLDKTTYVATIAILFIVINYVKLVPYAWLGQFGGENLLTSLALAPLAPVGMWLGIWCHKRVPEEWFFRVCYVLLFAAGVKQLFDGLSAQF